MPSVLLESMDPDEQRQRIGMALRFLGLAHSANMESQMGLCLVHCNAAVKALGDIPALVGQDFWDTLGIDIPQEILKLFDMVREAHPKLFDPKFRDRVLASEESRNTSEDTQALEDLQSPDDLSSLFTPQELGRMEFMKYLVQTKRVSDSFEDR